MDGSPRAPNREGPTGIKAADTHFDAEARLKRLRRSAIRHALRDRWESFRDRIAVLAFSFRVIVGKIPRPRMLLFFGYAPGDDLMCTAVLHELKSRGGHGLVMVTDHPGLFVGNADVVYTRPLWRRYGRYSSAVTICSRLAHLWGGRFVRLEYAPLIDKNCSRPPPRHIIAELCARAGVTGQVAIRPYLTLSGAEKANARWAAGSIVIQSSGLAARHPIRNKEWYPDRFQAVVDALWHEITFVQLGSPSDPPLHHARDLRGATSERRSAAVLHQARLFVGTVGFLMHLARAVDCPSVIIFGGREAPWQSGYSCNRNLYSAVPEAPCWRWDGCPCRRRCMDAITATDVVAAIREMLAKPRAPLAVETIDANSRHPEKLLAGRDIQRSCKHAPH